MRKRTRAGERKRIMTSLSRKRRGVADIRLLSKISARKGVFSMKVLRGNSSPPPLSHWERGKGVRERPVRSIKDLMRDYFNS
jgi:hypothetical protein